jgi:hypothetical protein
MASEGIRPRLRPLSLGEILDVSIKICVAHWRTLLKAVLVVVVPVQIVDTILTADYTVSSYDITSTSSQAEQSFEELNQHIGGLAISGLLQGAAVLLVTATCFRAIALAYLGESTDWRSSLSYALAHALPLLWLTLLYILGVGFATLFFVIPGIWLYVAWALAMPVLLVEGVRGRAALGRSLVLVKGRWWRTFGVLAVGFILAGIISTLVQGVFLAGIFVGSDNDALVLLFSALAGIVGLAIATPFQAAVLTVVYFDLRVRKEGFDLELLASEIGGSAPVAVGEPSPLAPAPAPEEEVDRTGGPHWPPPAGWKSPPANGNGDDDRDEDGDEPPRLPGVPHG